MDGFPFLPTTETTTLSLPVTQQRSVKTSISCAGIGLHSGHTVNVRILPAPANHGIVFRRTDLGATIPATFDNVVDTRMCTMIGLQDDPEARIGTIEHLMAALASVNVDNALIEVDGPEVPVLDGSSEPWLFLLDCAGIQVQDASRPMIQVLRTVRVQDGDAFAELRPGQDGLDLSISIAFDAAAIGRQALTLTLDPENFRRELARARTFAQKHEIDGLQKMGLARGGSLENAIVVDGTEILNPAGLRMTDEFVRHKMLDAVGDLALAGAPLQARFIGHKSGHALNNQVLHALFANPANWRLVNPADILLSA